MTRTLAFFALVVALAAPARAQSLCPHPVKSDPVRIACNVCNDGWSGMLTLAMPLDGFIFAKASPEMKSETALPILALGNLLYLGTEIGSRALGGEVRPFEHWVIILVARSLAASLTYVAARELPTAPAALASIAVTAAAAIPMIVLSPDEI